MTETDDSTDTYTLDVKDVEAFVGIAISANYVTMLMRNLSMVAGFIALDDLRTAKTPLSPSEQAWKIVQGVLIIAVGILPLWVPPQVSKERLARYNISPYLFTGVVVFVSMVLCILGSLSYYLWHFPSILIGLSLVNSFLVNELKYAEPYFASNWLPSSSYTDTSLTARSVAAFVVILPSMLAGLFKKGWIVAFAVPMVLFVSFFVAFPCRAELEKKEKYKMKLHVSQEYLPLEWNESRSNDFYKVDMRQENKLAFATYWFLQYL